MAKIPQRNVNLANKMMRLANSALILGQALTEPSLQQESHNENTRTMEDECLDTLAALREYRRKVSPIETVGNRG